MQSGAVQVQSQTYCRTAGSRIGEGRAMRDRGSRQSPILSTCRAYLQSLPSEPTSQSFFPTVMYTILANECPQWWPSDPTFTYYH
eukprot:8314305-Pyramimonas_sp.AAC.1